MKHYTDNPRQITEEQQKELQRALEEYGDLSGIVINIKTDEIIGGNQRSDAMGLLKKDVKPVIEHKFTKPTKQGTIATGYFEFKGERFAYRQVSWSLEKEKKANLIANKFGGSWNYEKLASLFSATELMDLGFDNNLLEQLKAEASALKDILSTESQLSEKTENIRPKEMMRVLVSIPVDLAIDAKEYFDALEKITGIEIDYGAN